MIISYCSQLARACYAQRIDLCAHGFFITPEIGFDWATGKGIPFRYFTYGAAFSEVEIDTLTGDFHTRSANVFLDLGHSLNPAIDVGQVLIFPLTFHPQLSSVLLEYFRCIFMTPLHNLCLFICYCCVLDENAVVYPKFLRRRLKLVTNFYY